MTDHSDRATADAQPSDGMKVVADLMDGIPFAMLTTIDDGGELVSRPMSHQDVEFDGDLWFISSSDARKVTHIQTNPHVAVTLASTSSWVSINGTAEIVTSREKAEELWSTEMEAWFPQGPDDESIVCIKVNGATAEYWNTPGGRLATAMSLVKVKLTGQRHNPGDNSVVDLTP